MRMAWAIGIDLGGTAVKIALIDRHSGIADHERHATRLDDGPEGVVEQIAALACASYHRGVDRFGPDSFAGVGLGAPGGVDSTRGILSYPPNLPGWTRYPLRDALRKTLEQKGLSLPALMVDNDANAAALGEAYFGAGQTFSDFMLVTLGTGVGGGIILNRSLYRGSHGTAGEIGFMTIDYRGQSVHAGVRGTLEGLIGKEKIVTLAKERYHEHSRRLWSPQHHGEDLSLLSPRTLEHAAHSGDGIAMSIWREVGSILGVGLAGAVALLDIRKFVIGGGISAVGDLVIVPALDRIRHSTLPSMHDDLEVIRASLGNDAGVYGAAALCFESP